MKIFSHEQGNEKEAYFRLFLTVKFLVRRVHWIPPLFVLVIALCGVLTSISCTNDALTNINQISFPDSNVSFKAQVFPFIQLDCDADGCHDISSAAVGISLESYGDVRATNIVDSPGDTTCGLLLVLKGIEIHPVAFAKPSNADLQGIAVWVKEGAKDN